MPELAQPQILAHFYDIESLRNVFSLCNYIEATDSVDVYLLDDSGFGNIADPGVRAYIESIIRLRNKGMTGTVTFYDLKTLPGAVRIVNAFGANDADLFSREVSSNTFSGIPGYQPFVKDTDEGYNESTMPYVMGYNSDEYDDTVLALFYSECWTQLAPGAALQFTPPTAALMRQYNNELFSPQYKNKMSSYLYQEHLSRASAIKKQMQYSGRHIDVSKLNEKSQHLALKRICGMLGLQILESEKLSGDKDHIDSLEELAELLAYNVSDCRQLKNVFHHKNYMNPFKLKRGMLRTYPEMIYKRKVKTDDQGRVVRDENGRPVLLYEPDIGPGNVAKNRLFIDSTSAKLAARALCPYGELDDNAVVSFLYPSEINAKKDGVPRINVLEESRMFFYSLYSDPDIRREFDRIYAYYKSLEGRNFNDADNYAALYSQPNSWLDPSKNRLQREYYTYLQDYAACRNHFKGNLEAFKQAGVWTSTASGISYKPSAFMDRDSWKFDGIINDYNLAVKTFQTAQRFAANGVWTSPLSGRIYQPADFIRGLQWKHPNEMYYPISTVYSVSDLPKSDTTLVYFKKDGAPSSCYVTFSIGGIHGAEYNQRLFEYDLAEYQQLESDMQLCQQAFPNPCDFKRAKEWTSPVSGIRYTPNAFLKSNSTMKRAEWKDISKKAPKLFKLNSKGIWQLNKKYVYTSSALSNHEDFTSYYPNLLIQLSAFWNEALGYDRYNEIFGNKEKYGKLMKDTSLPETERDDYSVLREGTKLVLNSASGAADTNRYTPIRMNNNIISMRLIGQLFTWRIGQAQTYEGASIISTNTDGLYSVMEEKQNAVLLAREAKAIRVAIEPELCYLISKDSNNRMEESESHKILSASGGSLACRKGPSPAKSLAHPAILDWAMCEYLRNADGIHTDPDFLFNDFNEQVAYALFDRALHEFDPRQYLLMMQNILSSSPGTITYNFGVDRNGGYKIMQHYNRIFLVKPDTTFTTAYHMAAAAARKIPPATKIKRQRNNERDIQHDPQALMLLRQYGIPEDEIPAEKEAVVKKISRLDFNQFVIIENRAYADMTDAEITVIINALDIAAYVQLLKKEFNNWRNVVPGVTVERTDDDDETESDEVIHINAATSAMIEELCDQVFSDSVNEIVDALQQN